MAAENEELELKIDLVHNNRGILGIFNMRSLLVDQVDGKVTE